MLYVCRIIKILILGSLIVNAGCVTVILDNDSVLSPPTPDPVRFADPVCVKLHYKNDNVGFINEDEGLKDMDEMSVDQSAILLPQFNIIQNCTNPVAEYTLVVAHKTRNTWARFPWAFVTVFSLGIVPYYVEDVGTVTLLENDKQVASADFLHKRLISIFAFPKAISDGKKSRDRYHANPVGVTMTRDQAIVIKTAIEAKNKTVTIAP